MENKGNTYSLVMKDLRRELDFFLYDSYNYPIANEIKKGLGDILNEPIRLATVMDNTRGGGFLDIGANIGQFSMVFAAYGYQVYAFEANSENAEQIRLSAKKGNFPIEVVNKAVTDRSGPLTFTSGGPWGNLFDITAFTTANDIVEMEGVALDDWYFDSGKPQISLLKMDIEGAELLALNGMKALLQANHYPPIYTEFCIGYSSYNSMTHADFLEAFHKLGYTPYVMRDVKTLYRYDLNDRCSYQGIMNYLMIHNSYALKSDLQVLPYPARMAQDFLYDAITCLEHRFRHGYAYTILKTPELLAEKDLVQAFISVTRYKNGPPEKGTILAELEEAADML